MGFGCANRRLFPAAFALGLPLSGVGVSVGLAIAALVVGMGMFAANWIGGGDAKLLTASVLWMGVSGTLPFILYTALAGGGFCLLLMTARSHLPFLAQTGPGWMMRLMQPGRHSLWRRHRDRGPARVS